jgi:chemotaxis protein histidine kinase CheA
MQEELEGIRRINDRFRSFAATPAERIDELEGLVVSLRRMTLDIARELGKKVRFEAEGTPRDPSLLAELRDPLIHLLRNAVDHGIEEPLERVGAGKGEEGTARIAFSTIDGETVIQVSDDGKGIDFDAVRKKAVAQKLVGSRPQDQTRSALLRVLFLPSFSSRDDVSAISGRGVGLDVVHAVIKGLGGQISVWSEPGKGTRFTLRIPARP